MSLDTTSAKVSINTYQNYMCQPKVSYLKLCDYIKKGAF